MIKSEIYWLAIVGLLNSVVSLYYYARIVKAMYFETSDDTDPISFTLANRHVLLIIFVIPTTPLIIGFIGVFYQLSGASVINLLTKI